MLPTPYIWTATADGGRELHYRLILVAEVSPSGHARIHWKGRTIDGQTTDMARAVAGVERWIERKGDDRPRVVVNYGGPPNLAHLYPKKVREDALSGPQSPHDPAVAQSWRLAQLRHHRRHFLWRHAHVFVKDSPA